MTISSSKQWAIVGGGMLGMTLALRLAQAGQSVTLIESAATLGGLASAWSLGDIVWDRHYHVTLLSDQHFRHLLRELGLEQDMQWVESKTGVYSNHTLYSVSNAIEFLKFPPLGLADKLRLAFTIIYGSKIKRWRRLEQISVERWLRRWSGDRTFEKFWLPLLRAKLGDNYTKASASFIWAIIARLYAARRTGLKKEMFGYLPGGYARILERFAVILKETGIEIQLERKVRQIQPTDDQQVILEFSDGTQQTFDQVVVTAASPIAAQITSGLTTEERDRLEGIQYQGIVCASLLLKKSLSPYYVTNITETWVPFTGVIEMTTLVNPQDFNGYALVYLPKYVDPEDPLFDVSNQDLEASFVSALERMYPNFCREDVLKFQVSRVKYVLAVSTLNYSQALPPMHLAAPGLHIVNSAHIPNGTLNVNETVQLAEQAAAALLTISTLDRGQSVPQVRVPS
jgi:protoporphyrinogen oxidase